jgi:hypothetical protein
MPQIMRQKIPQTMHHTTATAHNMIIRIQVRTQMMIKKIQHTHLLQHKHHQLQLCWVQDCHVVEIQVHAGFHIAVHTQTKNLAQQSYAEHKVSHIPPPSNLVVPTPSPPARNSEALPTDC